MKFGLFLCNCDVNESSNRSLNPKILAFRWMRGKQIYVDLTTKLCVVWYLQKNCDKQFDIVRHT